MAFASVNLSWVWIGTVAGVAILLALDLFVFHRRAHDVKLREAALFSALWLAIGLGFAGVVWAYGGGDDAAAYVTGFVVEKSLSLDNVFVFAAIFAYFGVPAALRYHVLLWGVILAIVLRAIFIVVGASLLEAFAVTAFVLGAFLVLTGIRFARHAVTETDPAENRVLRALSRRLPLATRYAGKRLFVREGGRRRATPLLAAFVAVGVFDLVFAFDSIPAIFAITTDTFVVFAANAFALLGLPALFFLVSSALVRLRYLNVGLGAVLVLVGVKMLVADWWKAPPLVSLALVLGVLGLTAIASLLRPAAGEATVEELPVPTPERNVA